MRVSVFTFPSSSDEYSLTFTMYWSTPTWLVQLIRTASSLETDKTGSTRGGAGEGERDYNIRTYHTIP